MTAPQPVQAAVDEVLARTSLHPSADTAQLHTPPKLASDPEILEAVVRALHRRGVVGEDRNAKLIYLAFVSGLRDEGVSVAIKGVSSSGKSHTVENVSHLLPASAFIEMTAMSERALVYMKEDFAHKTIVLFEAVALREQREKTESNMTAYFVRSLLSEGRIRYPVTQRDKDGNFVTRTIEKNGPTNLVLTTTATSLHGENETRLLSLPTNDTSDQTKAIFRQLASGSSKVVQDESQWHELYAWLKDHGERDVFVPFAGFLAEHIPPVAVRLRRDFGSLLRLIETHAMLHQCSRERDPDGRVIATEADYRAVRALVADLISDGVGATVSATMRETVEAVRDLAPIGLGEESEGVTVHAVAERLHLDRSATSRRLRAARERGFVVNQEQRRGRPARYITGEPLPDEVPLLPLTCTQDDESAGQDGVCSSAEPAEGKEEVPGWYRIQQDAGENPETNEAVALEGVRSILGARP